MSTLVAGESAGGAHEAVAEESAEAMFLPYARFKIPFSIDAHGAEPSQVQLWVSTDEGANWQMHGTANSEQRFFEFRAASEGIYWFSVRTLDPGGVETPSDKPPLKVQIDTSKPRAAVRGDIDSTGRFIVDVRVQDEFLNLATASLRMRTDRNSNWQDVSLEDFESIDGIFEAHASPKLEPCREVALAFTIADRAGNVGEATFKLDMPRTAANASEMTLASNRNSKTSVQGSDAKATAVPPASADPKYPQLVPLAGAIPWEPTGTARSASESREIGQPKPAADGEVRPGQLVSTNTPTPSSVQPQEPGLMLSSPATTAEELPLPKSYTSHAVPPTPPAVTPAGPTSNATPVTVPSPPAVFETSPLSLKPELSLEPGAAQLAPSLAAEGAATEPGVGPVAGRQPESGEARERLDERLPVTSPGVPPDTNGPLNLGKAFHSNSRAFSLDYSVEALGGGSLAEVELWGTEDGGRSWQKWGVDPDRVSPFDVQVGNDGLFGFRMVIIGSNGLVSNRPKDGEQADVWINIDTVQPTAKITRAVYGEGPEDGMLVIDYACTDSHIVDRATSLFYSPQVEGPWTTIATGLKNTQIYLWKPAPNMPNRVYLRLESTDKAGNVGQYTLDLPIDVNGLVPHGRIQGFRPISSN
ncbi:hypothetical protein [Aureliella helgolandensis]|nr:hypothetical protein [Aureliella helgolandensis]